MKLTVIGAGPGGYVAAVRAARQGCDVTVVERDGLGGVCLQHGCVPVKSLLISARTFTMAVNAGAYGVSCGDVSFDYARMVRRKDDIVAVNERGIEALLYKHRIRIVRGTAQIVSPEAVDVSGADGTVTRIGSDTIIIATGSSSSVPGFAALDNVRVFDCEGALALTSLPSSCAILGGGILGCEFASLFSDLGVKVTVIEMMDRPMPTFDKDLSAALARSFRRRGIDMRMKTSVEDVETDGEGVTVRLSGGGSVEAETCLVALGRRPNIEGIGLEQAGVALWDTQYRGIEVDSHLRTSVPGIYAVGDVNGIRPLAHVASAQGESAADHICGKDNPMRYDAVPDCFWANPEIASVGMTEQEARDRGEDVAVATFLYRSLGIAHALGSIEGFVKTVAERESGRVLGVHICGHGAPDLIAEASVIVANGLTVKDVEGTIHAHPTLGEIVKESILSTTGKNIHG